MADHTHMMMRNDTPKMPRGRVAALRRKEPMVKPRFNTSSCSVQLARPRSPPRMMSSEPQPSSTAEKSRFSMMAVTAIHHLLLKAWAKLGAIAAAGQEV
ncbi:hypothetical protein F7725_005188 [Dissostichus mawsoni]|uniref:Uncharacterized protein n=1 Tax=Dissostichus mawsoni TaxID=36200 RepID=A0A7J5YRQ1_DISMA|nr:hypothetical protein F7725_005188 [Dissostichus mawsoni]